MIKVFLNSLHAILTIAWFRVSMLCCLHLHVYVCIYSMYIVHVDSTMSSVNSVYSVALGHIMEVNYVIVYMLTGNSKTGYHNAMTWTLRVVRSL